MRWMVAIGVVLGLGCGGAPVERRTVPGPTGPVAPDAAGEAAPAPAPAAHTAPAPDPDPDPTAAPAPAPAPGNLGAPWRDGRIITGSTPHRLILFTFDDGPDELTTRTLLDRLDAAGVRAVFFLMGAKLASVDGPHAAEHAEIARETMRRGHVIGSHSFRHLRMDTMSRAEVEEQLARSEAGFQRVFGERTWLFRPPHGMRDGEVDAALAARGYTNVLWNINPRDYSEQDPEAVFQNFRTHLRHRERTAGDRGGIVLLHDTHAWSIRAFDLIHAWLLAENCRLLADPAEELYDVVGDPSFFHAPRGDAGGGARAPRAEPPAEVLAERQRQLRQQTAARCAAAR